MKNLGDGYVKKPKRKRIQKLQINEKNYHSYGMFGVTWATLKFNRNHELGTVSVYIMITMPWSNQCTHYAWRKITLQRISLWGFGPQVRWHQTDAQSSIIFCHNILKIVFIENRNCFADK